MSYLFEGREFRALQDIAAEFPAYRSRGCTDLIRAGATTIAELERRLAARDEAARRSVRAQARRLGCATYSAARPFRRTS
ncbi:hypothetical protein [Luteimonas sp. FCS-9]|uniref:hypothetical protein n=1 Tax=Luteimonas sp. FCS-9 TaxID=1547516 RepID=UPI00063E7686|nr:hypothetical protein [Luteimonas sp. FCS-9]KLJ02840.1 hypothetical protein WQ56_00725 [Luteimonas sp. FCS-9]